MRSGEVTSTFTSRSIPGGGSLRNESRFFDLLEEPLDELSVDLLVHERARPLRTDSSRSRLATGVPF